MLKKKRNSPLIYCSWVLTSGYNVTVNKKHEENEYNCKECDFQGSSEMQVRKHVNLKHTPKGRDTTGTIKCRICEQEFSEKWNLMRHRKTNHKDSVAFCRNFEDNNW